MKKIKIDEVVVTYLCDKKPTGGYRSMFNEIPVKHDVLEDIEHDFVNAIQDSKGRKPSVWEPFNPIIVHKRRKRVKTRR